MKKQSAIRMLALVLAGVMLLAVSGCQNLHLGQATAAPDAPGQTEAAPTDTTPAPGGDQTQEAAERASQFCERFNGTWTANDNSFIDIGYDEKKPAAIFGVWDSYAEFPEGMIEDAVETAEGEYDLTVRMNPTSAPVTMHVKSDNNAIFFTDAMSVTKRYEYDGKRQYPLTVSVLTPQEIMTLIGGLWTEALEGKEYLYVDMLNDGSIIIKVGDWDKEGYKTAYQILRVEADSTWEKLELTMNDADGKTGIYSGALYNAMNTFGLDLGTGEKAYNTDDFANHLGGNTEDPEDPAAVEAARRRALEFAFKVDGTWTTPDGPVFMDFDIENSEPWFMTAVWNSGGQFPSGHILDAVEVKTNEYELTVRMRDETAKRKMHCKINGYSMEFTDDTGEKKTLDYKPTKQFPASITDAMHGEIMYICGGIRTEATQRIEYLNVYEDSAGRVFMERKTWGLSDVKAKYRVIKIEYTNDVGTEINVILADDDYKVYDMPGKLLSADRIFHIDFGEGMHAYVEDFPENHTLEVNADTPAKRALEFAFLVDGTWNNKAETEFIDFGIEDNNEPWFMLAIWNAGGAFPSGKIIDAVPVKTGEYDVTVQMRDETKTRKFRAKLSGSTLEFIDMDYNIVSYHFDAEKQYPSYEEAIPRNQIMTYVGGVRTEAKYEKAYIYVYKDDNGNIWLDRRAWGMQGIEMRYRIVSIVALDMLYHELRVTLVDGKYNVYKLQGQLQGAEMIFGIDFGNGMQSFLEDSFENH